MTKEILDFSFFFYEKGDPYGFIFGVASLSPFFIVFSLLVVIYLRRELSTISFMFGQLFNEIISLFLKHVIKQARPDHTNSFNWSKHGYGMPSEHASFISFFVSYWIFYSVLQNRSLSISQKIISFLVLITLGRLTIESRLYLGVHTPLQLFCGILQGVLISMAFFLFQFHYLVPFVFPKLTRTWFARMFWLKDSSVVPNQLEFEYLNLLKQK